MTLQQRCQQQRGIKSEKFPSSMPGGRRGQGKVGDQRDCSFMTGGEVGVSTIPYHTVQEGVQHTVQYSSSLRGPAHGTIEEEQESTTRSRYTCPTSLPHLLTTLLVFFFHLKKEDFTKSLRTVCWGSFQLALVMYHSNFKIHSHTMSSFFIYVNCTSLVEGVHFWRPCWNLKELLSDKLFFFFSEIRKHLYLTH